MNTREQTLLNPERTLHAKAAYTTRHMPPQSVATLLTEHVTPCAGDVVLARIQKLGQHQHIELAHGRRARLFVGDEIIVSYGHRYAPDQFEALVPDNLDACHLVAAGGVAARVACSHDTMKKPTAIVPLGLLGDRDGNPLNLSRWAVPAVSSLRSKPLTIAVVGTSMNAGKTTTAAYLIKGLVAAGLRVGAAKLTGTGAGPDVWFMSDAGANPVLDFVDAGFASTYRASLEQLRHIAALLTGQLRSRAIDAMVLEIADGLYQEETAGLLSSPCFTAMLDGVIFATGDAMGASSGVQWLRQRKLPVCGLSGVLSRSPLATREAQEVTGLPVLSLEALAHPTIATAFQVSPANHRITAKESTTCTSLVS